MADKTNHGAQSPAPQQTDAHTQRDPKAYFFLCDALREIMRTYPKLKAQHIDFAAAVYYPIALVDITMEERVFENYEGIERHLLQFVADIGADPALLEATTGLSSVYVRKLLDVLDSYGHIENGRLTALGRESLQRGEKVTCVRVVQRLQMDALTLRLLKVEELIREDDLRAGQELGGQIGGILPNIEGISVDTLKRQIEALDLKEVMEHGENVLHANTESIQSIVFSELRYAKCVMTAFRDGAEEPAYCKPTIFGRRLTVGRRGKKTVWMPFFLYSEKAAEFFSPAEGDAAQDLIAGTEAERAQADALLARILERQQTVHARDEDGHAAARELYEKELQRCFDLKKLWLKPLPYEETDMGLIADVWADAIVRWQWNLVDVLLDLERHGGSVISYHWWYGGTLRLRAKDERVRRLAADVARAVEAHGISFVRNYWKELFLNDAGGTDADGRTLCDRLEASLDDARLDAYAKERKAREARGEK